MCPKSFINNKMYVCMYVDVINNKNRLTAGYCQCSYTYGGLLFIQVCSEATQVHCNTGQGKMLFPLLSAALQKQAHSRFLSVQLHLWRFAFHTGVQ